MGDRGGDSRDTDAYLLLYTYTPVLYVLTSPLARNYQRNTKQSLAFLSRRLRGGAGTVKLLDS